VFGSLNRNKRSLTIDVRGERGKAVIYDLIKTADVVVNNFRAGVMERMGFGYDTLAQLNPRIICAFGSGFGRSGPLAHKGGQDVLAQALSGVMHRRSDPSVPLSVYATTFGDYTAGMHLVQAILLALLQRERTGRGQQVAVSLFESLLALQMQEAAMWLQRQRDLNWGGFPLTGVFPTRDGALVLVGAFKPNPLQDICRALELPDLSADPRYADFAGQVEHKPVLQAMFRERFATGPTAHWLARLEEQDLLCAPVQTMAEALVSPQTVANGTVIALDAGAKRQIGTPLAMDHSAFRVRRGAPRLGEHSDEILHELGYPADKIATLRADKVVA
jgi:formyl-CoA transferase